MKTMLTFMEKITGIYILVVTVCLCLAACSEETLDRDSGSGLSVSPFARAAVDPVTLDDFRRTYGVGFSYDAIYGERCNLKDIRCQVLDYKKIIEWQNAESWHEQLITVSKETETSISSDVAYSRSEYIQSSVFHADVDAKLIVFSGSATADATLWEGGDTNDFFCNIQYTCPELKVSLDGRSLKVLIQDDKCTELLSENFREAVDWMKSHNTAATIDSFLVRYGSHVVTYAKLGGCLNIRMNMHRDSLTDVVDKQVLGEAAVMGILNSKIESEEHKRTLNLINGADCCVSIKGGNLSLIPNELLHFIFGERPNLSTYISDWAESISYDPDSYQNSNLEITNMEVMPIWNFIPDAEVADMVRMHVEGTASKMINTFGYKNVVSTSFRIPDDVTCKMGDNNSVFTKPAIVNVIAAGRYVAAICNERIDAINPKTDVQVVYPIYDRQINMKSGFCIDNGKAYSVRWTDGECTVEPLGVVDEDNTIYFTCGVAGTTRFANITYQPCHLVIGYEWPYAIKKDGTLDTSKPYYLVYKSGSDFYLRTIDGNEQRGMIEGLPNWTYDSGIGRMVRDKDYRYYWNPMEVSY